MNKDIAILILAAGESSRMKEVKQLLPWRDTTLLGHAIRTAEASLANNIFIVLGANRDRIRSKVKLREAVIIENEEWKEGMGGSIATGVKTILNEQPPAGILIMVCDQPLIDTTYLDAMIHEFNGNDKGIVATSYPSKLGVPALFGTGYFDALGSLQGDKGAGILINSHLSDCVAVDPKGKEIDIDTAETYNRLYSSSGSDAS